MKQQKIKELFCDQNASIFDVFNIFNNAVNLGLPAGIAIVTDAEDKIIGTITDGDIRRQISEQKNLDFTVGACMQTDPIIFSDKLARKEIIELMPVELAKRQKGRKFISKLVLVNDQRVVTEVLDYHQLFEQKVGLHRRLVVIGLGYVGLTMAAVMADAGFTVIGVEMDEDRVNTLNSGGCYIHEVGLPQLIKKHIHKKLFVTKELPDDGDVFIISVGTPVVRKEDGTYGPIMNYLEDACNQIAGKLTRGNLVILRSTVPIGTSRTFVKDRLEKLTGLTCGRDFHLAFAPERTAEGKALKELRNLPQIIGGFNEDSTEASAAIFRDVTPTIVRVDSLEAAEMAKLINNTFRDYIFAYSNEMARIASVYNVNVVDEFGH